MTAEEPATEVPIRSLRLVVMRPDETLGKLARLYWSAKDASLYVRPYAPVGGRAYAGIADVEQGTIDFTKQNLGESAYLSLHASGQAHATVQRPDSRTANIEGAPLYTNERSHIATIQCFDTSSLPRLNQPPKLPPDLDLVLVQRPELPVAVIAVFVSAIADALLSFKFRLNMIRPGMPGPLHFGFRVRGTDGAVSNDSSGVVVLGGWGIDANTSGPLPFVYAVTGNERPSNSPGS